MTKEGGGGGRKGRRRRPATTRFRASQSGSTNYEVKIDEPLSGPSRAESPAGRRKDERKGGGKAGGT